MSSRHTWKPRPITDLQPGDRIWPVQRGRVRIVNKVERWTRWDGEELVTVVDRDGCALAARPPGWLVSTEVWEDDHRVLRPLQGRERTPLLVDVDAVLAEVEEVLGGK